MPRGDFDHTDPAHYQLVYQHFKSDDKVAEWSGVPVSTCRFWRTHKHKIPIAQETYKLRHEPDSPPRVCSPLAESVKGYLAVCKERQTIEDLADRFEVCPRQIREAVADLEAGAVLVDVREDSVALERDLRPHEAPVAIDFAKYRETEVPLGVTADNHLCSKYERLDVLESLYDRFEAAGVQTVLNGGNWIDGEARFNKFDIHVYGLDDQLAYFAQHYPQRPGMKTLFVSGDDHEGWYVQREHVNIGKRMEQTAREAGREDLIDLGYMERDLVHEQEGGSSTIRLIHAGGGSAYATSYTMQKYVESLQGGEKPQIVIAGHYHKYEVGYPREVHVIQPGCTQDQTPFMRKRKLQAHVGGCILWVKQNELGIFTSVKVEWLPYYDRAFYEYRW